MMADNMFDENKNHQVPTPARVLLFMEEYERLCKKHNLTLSHEDGHGSFRVESFKQENLDWVFDSNLRLEPE